MFDIYIENYIFMHMQLFHGSWNKFEFNFEQKYSLYNAKYIKIYHSN